MDMIG